jgi:hypothetical protein
LEVKEDAEASENEVWMMINGEPKEQSDEEYKRKEERG